MKDQVVRRAFHQKVLRAAHTTKGTFVIDELGLKNGQVRADIAVVNGKLIGYEIKSQNDTLTRLPNQITAYNEVFDNIYIITASNHLAKVRDAISPWWGIYIINGTDDITCSFTLHRPAKPNKFRNCLGLAQLLWKNEVLEILNERMKFNLRHTVSKEELYDILSGTCASANLSKLIINYLKTREGWRKDLARLS